MFNERKKIMKGFWSIFERIFCLILVAHIVAGIILLAFNVDWKIAPVFAGTFIIGIIVRKIRAKKFGKSLEKHIAEHHWERWRVKLYKDQNAVICPECDIIHIWASDFCPSCGVRLLQPEEKKQ